MVGIYAKIKNGLNWLKDKATKYVAPVIGKIGDIAQSDIVQGIAGVVAPALNAAFPMSGTALTKGLDFLGKAGNVANAFLDDYKQYGDNFSVGDLYNGIKSGKYNTPLNGLSKRPDQLHERIELKSLPLPSGPVIEEVD